MTTVPLPVLPDPSSKPLRISPTDVSQFVRLEQCERYWFDFGDDWWHQINVEAIEDKLPKGNLPKVTKKVGKSPPQYSDEDE